MLRDPAVAARVEGPAPLPLGTDVVVRLVEADPARRAVRFEPTEPNPVNPAGGQVAAVLSDQEGRTVT
jgi:hypothetical protein